MYIIVFTYTCVFYEYKIFGTSLKSQCPRKNKTRILLNAKIIITKFAANYFYSLTLLNTLAEQKL